MNKTALEQTVHFRPLEMFRYIEWYLCVFERAAHLNTVRSMKNL